MLGKRQIESCKGNATSHGGNMHVLLEGPLNIFVILSGPAQCIWGP
jgi:hypothetical protein